tara:strand:- start:2203 stop:3645 length:1443 start_codon:yes stop_codon:yes gene_type:complete
MPKLTREKTLGKDRSNKYKGNIKDLKNKVCTMISDLIKTGGRVNIIFNYLVMVQENMGDNKDKIPSTGEIYGDLITGLKELVYFKGELIVTPSLNQEEEKNIYLTSDEAKKVQLKKDHWLQRFTNSNSKNIMEWLSDDSVKKMFELTGDDHETPRPSMEQIGDQWEDISIIYNNTIAYLRSREEEAGVTELLSKMPSNIPLTHISINKGKIHDYELFIIEMGETLLKRSSNLALNIATIFARLGLTTLKIGGYTMAIATKFISDLFVNILRNKIHSGLWSMIEQGVGYFVDSPFIITDNKTDIQAKIDHKYRLFLCLIIVKTIFMLGILIFRSGSEALPVIDSRLKLRQIINFGFDLLDIYTKDKNYNSLPFVSDKFPEIRRQIDDIMKDMNKLTEWYLMRKTIVFDMENKELLILDKKEFRNMTASEIDDIMGRQMDLEPETEDESGAKRKGKKKRTKRRRKSSKKKKKKKQTKHRKKK